MIDPQFHAELVRLLEWKQLPRSIRACYDGLDFDVWAESTVNGRIFKWTLYDARFFEYLDCGEASTQEDAQKAAVDASKGHIA